MPYRAKATDDDYPERSRLRDADGGARVAAEQAANMRRALGAELDAWVEVAAAGVRNPYADGGVRRDAHGRLRID